MKIIEATLLLAWFTWFGFYWKLAWTKGEPSGPSYLKMFFPILLFFGNNWPAGTEITRFKLQVGLFIIVVATAGAQYVSLVQST